MNLFDQSLNHIVELHLIEQSHWQLTNLQFQLVFNLFRYASCVGGLTEHCEPKTEATEVLPAAVQDTYFAYFIGYALTTDETSVALHVNFVLTICLGAFALFLVVLSLIKFYRKPFYVNPENGSSLNTYVNKDVTLL